MASSASAVPLRQLLDDRITRLLNDAESLASEVGDRARRETADQLNQAVRRMRQATETEEVLSALLDAAAAFATGVALFLVEGDAAKGLSVRGVAEAAGDFAALEIPLVEAPALAGAAESRDPVVTATTPASVSSPLAAFLGHTEDGRAWIFPVVSRDAVVALAYAWGAVEGPPIELLAEVAGAVWSGIRKPTPAPADLISIVPAAGPASPWESLSAREQSLHLRAQRFARVRVAEMRLHHAGEVEAGRTHRDLYGALAEPIDAARAAFRESFFDACPSMVDYLHLELLRILAHDDPELLGETYPGVMV
jgi:DNA gyrase/topoisomerase IV subunit B